jgi:prepilin-type N-terminal cleavage/methylation domain-containing protein
MGHSTAAKGDGRSKLSGRHAFSLIELLVVLAIIGTFIALLVPAVQKVRAAADLTYCRNNLKQMGLALHHYHGVRGSFPPGFISTLSDPTWRMPKGNCNAEAPDLGPGWSLFALILPYLEQEALYSSIRLDLPIADPLNDVARRTSIPLYICPSDTDIGAIPLYNCGNPPSAANTPTVMTDAGKCSYVGCLGGGKAGDPDYGCYEYQPFNGVFHRNSRIRVTDIIDGTSTTVGIGERNTGFVQGTWVGVVPGHEVLYNPLTQPPPYNPALPPCQNLRPSITAVLVHSRMYTMNAPNGSPASFHSAHTGCCNFLFMDGSCRTLFDGIDLNVMRALCTRNNGEVVSSDD